MLRYYVKHLGMSAQTIALEDTTFGNFKDLVSNVIPSIIGGLKNVFSEYKKEDAGAIPNDVKISRKDSKFIDLINRRPYLSICDITLFVPEGMCVKYSEYIQKLINSVTIAEYTINELTEYSIFISKLINDKNYQLSTEFIDVKVNEIKTAIDNDKKDMAACFEKGSTKVEVKYKTLLENNSEWVKIFTDMENLTNRVSKIDKRAINEKIESISALVDVLLKKIKNGELDNASPAVVAKMGEYTYTIALLLELFSVVNYRVIVLSTAITDSVNKTTKIITAK